MNYINVIIIITLINQSLYELAFPNQPQPNEV